MLSHSNNGISKTRFGLSITIIATMTDQLGFKNVVRVFRYTEIYILNIGSDNESWTYSKLGMLFPFIKLVIGSLAIKDADLHNLLTSIFKLLFDSISITPELPFDKELTPICSKFLSDLDKTFDSTKALSLLIFIRFLFSHSVDEGSRIGIEIFAIFKVYIYPHLLRVKMTGGLMTSHCWNYLCLEASSACF